MMAKRDSNDELEGDSKLCNLSLINPLESIELPNVGKNSSIIDSTDFNLSASRSNASQVVASIENLDKASLVIMKPIKDEEKGVETSDTNKEVKNFEDERENIHMTPKKKYNEEDCMPEICEEGKISPINSQIKGSIETPKSSLADSMVDDMIKKHQGIL